MTKVRNFLERIGLLKSKSEAEKIVTPIQKEEVVLTEKQVEPISKPIKPKKKEKVKPKKVIFPHPEILVGLDEGQKEAVLTENPRTLVLAGAGAGKTKVVLSRILHLLKNKDVQTNEILAMTFTRDATNEMIDRLYTSYEPAYEDLIKSKLSEEHKEKAKKEMLRKHPELKAIWINTIHGICYRILKNDGAKEFNDNFKVIIDGKKQEKYESEYSQERVMKEVFNELLGDEDFAKTAATFATLYLKPKDFETNSGKFQGKVYGLPYRTIDGRQVRSKSEQVIANFLCEHNINYIYEPEADWVTKDSPEKTYHPDFYLPDYDVYIEHWLVTDNKQVLNNMHQGFNKESYLKDRLWKLEQFKKHNKVLIETSEEQIRNLERFYPFLESELIKKTSGKILIKRGGSIKYLKELEKEINYLQPIILDKINLKKSNDISVSDIKQRLSDEKHEEINMFFDLFFFVDGAYQRFLHAKSLIDFNDMVIKVNYLFKKNDDVLKKYQNERKYIFVDEYQDVSASQAEFIKLLTGKDNWLFAVGDDWQSIYGFRGSEVEFILNFDKEFSGSKRYILPYNYRSGNAIVEASKEVIRKNKNQVFKDIKSKKSSSNKIFQFNPFNNFDAAKFINNKVVELKSKGYTNENFLILYRRTRHYNDTIKEYLQVFPELKSIPRNTIHGSKGLEAPVVFLLGLIGGGYGFPAVWEDPRINLIIKPTKLDKKEEEERRMFYVAMTRAKDHLFLMSQRGNVSSYCRDVPSCYKVVNISQQFPLESLAEEDKIILTLIEEQKTLEDIAKIFKLELQKIEERVEELIKVGIISVDKFVNKEDYKLISFVIGDNIDTRLTPIKYKLPGKISFGEIRFVRADLVRKKSLVELD